MEEKAERERETVRRRLERSILVAKIRGEIGG